MSTLFYEQRVLKVTWTRLEPEIQEWTKSYFDYRFCNDASFTVDVSSETFAELEEECRREGRDLDEFFETETDEGEVFVLQLVKAYPEIRNKVYDSISLDVCW